MRPKDEQTDADSESRLLQCTGCESFYPGKLTNDGELVPVGGAPDNQCATCGSREYVQVTFDSLGER